MASAREAENNTPFVRMYILRVAQGESFQLELMAGYNLIAAREAEFEKSFYQDVGVLVHVATIWVVFLTVNSYRSFAKKNYRQNISS